MLGKVIHIFQGLFQSKLDIILSILGAHKLSAQIKGLRNSATDEKGSFFISYVIINYLYFMINSFLS